MKQVSIKFKTLNELADCVYQLGLYRPFIDYENRILKGIFTQEQLNHVLHCKGEIIDEVVPNLTP